MIKLSAGLACLVLAIPAAASAGTAFEATTSVVARSSGLDLSRSADAAVMLQRLDRAALKACGASTFSLRQVRDAVRRSPCHREAMETAVASLNAPTVSALYRQQAPLTVARN